MFAPRRVLVPRFDTFGDIVLLQGLLGKLQEAWPEAELHLLVRRRYMELSRVCSPRLQWHATDLEPLHVPDQPLTADLDIVPLLHEKWDLLLGTQFSASWLNHEIAKALAARGVRCVELSKAGDARSAGEREFVPVAEHSHETEKYQALWTALTGSEEKLPEPRLLVPEETKREALDFVRDAGLRSGRFIACGVGGASNNPFNMWSPSAFAQCAAEAERKHGLRTIFFGHVSERLVVDQALAEARRLGASAAAWTGRDGQLDFLAALLASARLYVGNDTGPMHIAQAVGTDAVAVFGGWTWPRFAPTGRAIACLSPRACFGCGGHCLYGDAPCISSVTTEDVIHAVDEMLNGADHQGYRVRESPDRTRYSEPLSAAVAQRFIEVSKQAGRAGLLERSLERHQQYLAERVSRCNELEAQFEDLRTDPFQWLITSSTRLPQTISIDAQGQRGLVSVVIPVYNAAPFLERSIASVWEQEKIPAGCTVEILACDDGSKDGSAEIIADLARRSPVPLRLLRHEGGRNLGVSATRNLAISESRGEFVALLDADDRWLPHKLATQIRFFEERPEAQTVCSWALNRDLEGNPVRGWNGSEIGGTYEHLPPPDNLPPPYTFELLLQGDPVVNSTVMIRRSALARTGGYSAVMAHQAEDWLLFLKLALASPVQLIREPLIEYLVHSGSYTHTYFTAGLAYGARLETLYQLLHWMLQNPEYRPKAQWLYRRQWPALMAPYGRAYRLIEELCRRSNGDADQVAAFEAHLQGVYQERDELRAYKGHIEAQLDLLRRVPGVKATYHAARALYRAVTARR